MHMNTQNNPERLNPWCKIIRHVGFLLGTDMGWASWIFAGTFDDTEESELEGGIVASAVGATIGLLVALGIVCHRFFKRKKEGQLTTEDDDADSWLDTENDPWNARVKVGVAVGEGIGSAFLLGIPFLPEKILLFLGRAIGGFLGGIIAFFTPAHWWTTSPKKLTPNPLSERLRSGTMLGSLVGTACSLFFLLMPTALSPILIISLCAGVGILLAAVVTYGLTEDAPPENKKLEAGTSNLKTTTDALKTEQLSIEKPTQESNPWAKRVRAGVQWGGCVGILLGALVPGFGVGLSIPISVILGGALASIGGALISLAAEPIILSFKSTEYVTDNPWGPRCRFGVAWGTSIGMIIGCLLFPGFAGATAGGAIGGLMGGLIAVISEPLYLHVTGRLHQNQANKNALGEEGEGEGEAEKDKILENSYNPWAERCRSGTMVGAAIGALIGLLCFPPLGMFYGAGIGGALGGIIAYLVPSEEKPPAHLEEEKNQWASGAEEEKQSTNQARNIFLEEPGKRVGKGMSEDNSTANSLVGNHL